MKGNIGQLMKQAQPAAEGLLQRDSQLVGIRLVGEMAPDFGDSEHELVAGDRLELGLSGELQRDSRQAHARHEGGPSFRRGEAFGACRCRLAHRLLGNRCDRRGFR